MLNIKVKKLEELDGFDPDFFLADPLEIKLDSAFSDELIRKAAKKVEEEGVNGICVAIIKDEHGDFAVSIPCSGGRAHRFVFFNAVLCDPLDGEIRAIVNDPENQDDLIFDEFLKCEQGYYF